MFIFSTYCKSIVVLFFFNSLLYLKTYYKLKYNKKLFKKRNNMKAQCVIVHTCVLPMPLFFFYKKKSIHKVHVVIGYFFL